jgi:formamidopyrimidine-DNA glycosylase
MPELPDLIYVRAKLEAALLGRTVTAARLRKPVVLRCLVPGDLDLLVGQTLRRIHRRLHFLVFGFERHALIVNPMLAGRFRMAAADPAKRPAALALELTFKDASALQYIDDKQMGKVYLAADEHVKGIPGFEARGVDVLSPEFTLERFASLVAKRRDQVRVFLMDKDALDSLGNAYADEVLFAAGIHPKTWCRSLKPDDVARLHAAIASVLRDAIAEVQRRGEPTETKVRDFLKVRMKDVCPRCGGKIRRAGVRGMDAYFCPHCQPATREALVDWTRTGR